LTVPTPSPLDSVPHWKVRFQKGHLIYDEGDPTISMYRIENGCVRLQVNGEDGERQIVTFLFPGDVFGFTLDRRNSAAEAVTEVELTRFATQTLLEAGRDTSEIKIELINRANAMFNEVAHHLQRITHLPATERVIWFLDWLVFHQGGEKGSTVVRLPMSHRDIADFLSLKPETLSRVVKQLTDKGAIVRTGRRSFILKRPKFESDPPEPAGRIQRAAI
jgi:CRP-like cAMP-binding protein